MMRNMMKNELLIVSGGRGDQWDSKVHYTVDQTQAAKDFCGSKGTEFVPDQPIGFDFSGACESHDNAYSNQVGKDIADKAFWNDMREVCKTEATNPFSRAACDVVAFVYYAGVRLFGNSAYNASNP